jgi:tRNA (cytidine/uridine-2'-O-)-methyltransferase
MKKNEQMRHSERKRVELEFHWPADPLNIVLVEPSIPPNTGNISRLCAATGTKLHLVEPLGFDLSEKQLRRAGLDYWDSVELTVYPNFDTFMQQNPEGRKWYCSTAGKISYLEAEYSAGDFLIFGNETVGLPDELLVKYPDAILNIPIKLDSVRSLNLSNCASIVLYEALRQVNLIIEQ